MPDMSEPTKENLEKAARDMYEVLKEVLESERDVMGLISIRSIRSVLDKAEGKNDG